MAVVSGVLKKSAAVLVAVLWLAQGVWAANAAQNAPVTGNASSYTVTFNPKGGAVTPTSEPTGEAGTLTSLPVPVRNGYTFYGWFTDTTGGKQVSPNTVFSANTAVYARWALITYTVTFDADGGKGAVASATTGEGGTLSSLPAPTKTGYTFAGWYTSPVDGARITTITAFGANTTVYARWTLITHTVKFDAKGGTVTPTVGITGEGGTLASLPAPVRNGYNFSGWFTAAAGGDSVTAGKVYDANTTIYARWTPVVYTVTFNATDGAVSPKSGATGEGWKLASLPVPTKTGYAFQGWFTAATGGDSVSAGKVYKANTTIYAQWKLVTYTVTFNANGGKVTPASGTTGEGWTLASLPTPTRSGYIFDGWFTASTGGSLVTTATVYSANTAIYAQWTLVTYTVTFNTNGGRSAHATGTTGEGWKLALLPAPTKAGYTFDGWFTASTGGTAVTADRAYSANTTIHARWTLITYKVTFEVNITGGKVSPASGTTGKGWKLASLPTPTRDGYAFEGWFTSAAGGDSVTANTAFSANTTIYARWRLTTSTIKFDATGGAVSPAYGTTGEGWKLASLPTPVRDGYTFAGWFTAATGGTAVTTGMMFSTNATIYARWTLITYSVTFEPNITGGKVTPVSATTGEGWALASLPTPVKDGYAFDGWYTAATGGAEVTPNTAFSENAVIYARWTAAYTITFNANGGAVSPASSTTGAGRRLASLPTPSRTGYTFDGWYTAAAGGTAIPADRAYSANATLYARWTPAPATYTITFNANGSTVTPASAATDAEGRLASLPTPTKPGYIFDGWYTALTGGTKVTVKTVFSENATIYARWVAV